MPVGPGTRLASYEIIGALGSGGMGEVYPARDLKLNRDVAIKVLPASLTSNSDRLARFQREAQVLTAESSRVPCTVVLNWMSAFKEVAVTLRLRQREAQDQVATSPTSVAAT
jgi:hypothetical protein